MSFPLYGYMKKNLASKRSDIEKEMWNDILSGENMTEMEKRNKKRARDYFGDGNIEKNMEALSLLEKDIKYGKLKSLNDVLEQIEYMKQDSFCPRKQFDENEIICSNWDFINEKNTWTIDGISMSRKSLIAGPYGCFVWKLRMRDSLFSPPFFPDEFKHILRMSYITQYHTVYIPPILILFLVIYYTNIKSRIEELEQKLRISSGYPF